MITQQEINDFAEYDREDKINDLKDYTPLDMVKEFATAMDHPLGEKYGYSRKLEGLRWLLLKEEYNEVRDADGPQELLKELADLVYVTYGYAATYGWDLDEAIRRVHLSNMSKLGTDGKPLKDAEGKVMKGPNYKKPTLKDLVETNNE